jgi:hypothetical protein
VATLTFAREVLGLPAPDVFFRNGHADDRNPIGAEYIIMNKMGGVELVDGWHEIQKGQLAGCFKDLLAVENNSRAFDTQADIALCREVTVRDFMQPNVEIIDLPTGVSLEAVLSKSATNHSEEAKLVVCLHH